MADARDSLNMGDVLKFIHGDTNDLTKCDNGVYISNTYTAEIGKEIKAGERLSFQLDNIYMKNGAITELGVGGDPIVIPDPDAWGYQVMYYIDDDDDCAHSVVLDHTFNNATGHRTLIAAYLTYTDNTTDYITGLSFLFYDADDDSILTSYTNNNNQNILYVDMTSDITIRADICGRTGGGYDYEFRLNTIANGTGYTWATLTQAHNIRDWHFQLATSFSTNIPVFDTQAHAEAYLRDNTVLTGLLNGDSSVDPEEAYKEQFDFWYIKNVYGHNTRSLTGFTDARNYRFFPKSEIKIALLYHTPTSAEPYNYKLITDYNYNVKSARPFEYDDEDYNTASTWYDEYLKNSISFGDNDYYSVFKWDTNIPTIDTQEDMDDYFAGRKTIDEVATNWKDIARQNNDLVAPDLPGLDKDDETPTGSNGMVYTYGAKLYEVTNIELAALFSEMFDTQNLQSILDGNKLFGADVFNAISNIVYLPLSDLSDICSFGSGTNNIWIGSWESQNAQGRLISKNDKKINCGSFFFADNFGDFRSLDPFQRFFAMIPFCGFFELTVSKYIGKTVKVEMAIDITTGGVLAMLYANDILMDQFSGQCGASRPVTARHSATYFSNIVNAITGSAGTFGSAGKGAMQAAKGLTSGAGGAAVLGGAALGVGVAAVGAVGGTLKAYQLKEAIDSPPIMSSGALAGCMSYFSNTKVHFIVAQKKTVRPLNELETIGYPSNQGGTVGSFSGFLSCSAFKMADSFTGTKRELQMIYDIMKGGIYI